MCRWIYDVYCTIFPPVHISTLSLEIKASSQVFTEHIRGVQHDTSVSTKEHLAPRSLRSDRGIWTVTERQPQQVKLGVKFCEQNKNTKCRQRKEALGIQGTKSEVEGAASAKTPYPRHIPKQGWGPEWLESNEWSNRNKNKQKHVSHHEEFIVIFKFSIHNIGFHCDTFWYVYHCTLLIVSHFPLYSLSFLVALPIHTVPLLFSALL